MIKKFSCSICLALALSWSFASVCLIVSLCLSLLAFICHCLKLPSYHGSQAVKLSGHSSFHAVNRIYTIHLVLVTAKKKFDVIPK